MGSLGVRRISELRTMAHNILSGAPAGTGEVRLRPIQNSGTGLKGFKDQ